VVFADGGLRDANRFFPGRPSDTYADDCCGCLHLLAEQYADVPRGKLLHITNFEWSRIIDIVNIIAGHFPGTTALLANLLTRFSETNAPNRTRSSANTGAQKFLLEEGTRPVVAYYSSCPTDGRRLALSFAILY